MIGCSRQLLRWLEAERPAGQSPPPSEVLNPMIPWEGKERRGAMVRREARRRDQIIREGGEGVTVGVRLQKQLTGGGGVKKKRRDEEEDRAAVYTEFQTSHFSIDHETFILNPVAALRIW